MTLFEAACLAQSELRLDLNGLEDMRRPDFLTEEQWQSALERKRKLDYAITISEKIRIK